MSTSPVGAADDRFHAPAEAHPLWSETAWFGFSAPERKLCGAVYPLFRPRLGVCSIAVHVFDDSACEPWRALYSRTQWHLPMPRSDLSQCSVGGLELVCLEPLRRYRVRYTDAELCALDLEYEGLFEPFATGIAGGRGHLDQPCRVRGSLWLREERIAIDGFEMRDRSWHVRDDLRSTRASYSYGVDEREAFLALALCDADECRIATGFLWRDGEKRALVGGTRHVQERRDGHPLRVEVAAVDAAGRHLEVEGTTLSRLANQATPGMFAWLSLTEWSVGGRRYHGEDQEIWSPDLLARGGQSARR
ncbi:MAG TPA: hypothetical protein VMW19_12735 [Myxococcota bacterium]|nr:hypothetical protein [Myxococcota bacterium]